MIAEFRHQGRQDSENAEAIAAAALGFIARDEDRLQRFMDLTGLAPADIRARVREPGFLAAVLEYLVGDERLLVAFAEDAGIEPEAPGMALATLAAG